MSEWLNHIENQYMTQPCDRPGLKHAKETARQELINRSAAVAEEYERMQEAIEDVRFLKCDIVASIRRNYEDELCRIEAEIDALS